MTTQVDLTRSEGHSKGEWVWTSDNWLELYRSGVQVSCVLESTIKGPTVYDCACSASIEHSTNAAEAAANKALIEDAPLIRAELIRARERIAQLEAAAAWRPIADAPVTGLMLVKGGVWETELGAPVSNYGVALVEASANLNYLPLAHTCYYSQHIIGATHYRPLPAAPTIPTAEGGE
jgi:hypothetical protein